MTMRGGKALTEPPVRALLRRAASVVLVLITLAPLASETAFPRSATDAEKAAIADTVAAFGTAVADSDYEALFGMSVPPRLIAAIGKRFGATTNDLRQEVMKVMTAVMAAGKIEKFDMDANRMEYREDANGQPYALIPTTVTMVVGDKRAAFAGYTLAIHEENRWWLIRIEDKQLPILRAVYPELSNADFPKETMVITKQ